MNFFLWRLFYGDFSSLRGLYGDSSLRGFFLFAGTLLYGDFSSLRGIFSMETFDLYGDCWSCFIVSKKIYCMEERARPGFTVSCMEERHNKSVSAEVDFSLRFSILVSQLAMPVVVALTYQNIPKDCQFLIVNHNDKSI